MSTTDAPRRRSVAALALVVGIGLFAGLLSRSTETWTAHDPAAMRRLLELREEARDLARRWETAQRGETRFAYDTEIRVSTARIEEMEARAQRPRRIVGLAPWRQFADQAGAIAASLLDTVVATAITVALAFAAVLALQRAGRGVRLAATAIALAPLALPPTLLADRFADLAVRLGLGPSPALAGAAALLVAFALAVLVLAATSPPLDPARRDVARDLGLSRRECFRRIVAEPRAGALGLATVVVFARLLGDVSLARLGATGDRLDRWAGWLRHRTVAAVDHATAAAGTLAAIAACLLLAGVVVWAVRRVGTPPAPTRVERPPRGASERAIVPVLAGLLAAVAIAVTPTRDALAPVAVDQIVAGFVELARAGLAALLALALADVIWRPFDRADPRTRRRLAALALATAALPAPAIAFALRTAGDLLGLAAGGWISIATGVVAATPLVLLLALGLAPLGETAASATHGLDRRARLRRLAPLRPLAAVLAASLAIAATDGGIVVGLADRPHPWATGVDGIGISLVLLAFALAFGHLAARALEGAADRGGRSGPDV